MVKYQQTTVGKLVSYMTLTKHDSFFNCFNYSITIIQSTMTDKTKMIYNDDQTIGVDESSLNQLMNILTPRMQKQLVDELHNNLEVKQ